MLKLWALTLFTLALSTAHAGKKDDFINAVKSGCQKSQADAEAMATPGRTGNVIKWAQCKSGSISINGCDVPCSDASSKIGK